MPARASVRARLELHLPQPLGLPGRRRKRGLRRELARARRRRAPLEVQHHLQPRHRRSTRLRHAAQHDGEVGKDYHLRRNKANRYLQDREEMQTRSFIGLGPFFAAHDKFAVEGPGPIQDREAEHTATTDKAIVAARMQLLKAIQDVKEGRDPLHLIRTPGQNRLGHVGAVDVIAPNEDDWRTIWRRYLPVDEPVGAR